MIFVCSDATAEYIHGKSSSISPSGVHREGLRCVVVLIGVYDIRTGLPVAGVLNQPFVTQDPATQRQALRIICSYFFIICCVKTQWGLI